MCGAGMQLQNTIEFVMQVWRVVMGLVILDSMRSLIKMGSIGYLDWSVGLLFILLVATFWRFFYGNWIYINEKRTYLARPIAFYAGVSIVESLIIAAMVAFIQFEIDYKLTKSIIPDYAKVPPIEMINGIYATFLS